MYQPSGVPGSPVESGLENFNIIKIQNTSGNTLVSWHRPSDRNKPTLVYFQGNAGNISDRAYKAKVFIKAGFGVFLVGYRGFGENSGTPSELGLYEDADLAIKYLLDMGVPHKKIYLYGESLGTAVAVEIAYRYAKFNPIGGVILEAPFTSMADAAQYHYPFFPVKHLVNDKYESIKKIDKIDTPLLIFHGEKDRTVPIKFGKLLFKKAEAPKVSKWIPGAGHGNVFDFFIDKDLTTLVNVLEPKK